ncbi:hypothetical protein JK162_01675 [Leuconostoc pseudomesenteroides]|uniref:hypothetical protein n=1 Tax=Leuconostoc pseudomesenteroides TaxID=33968 RepID=UPI001B8D48F9|nr:hypothetical protein [Leuconostoc pseudomesenteroides]MBS0957210.1 hypothetical protein [Leuconostoc pseudomesenteroides]
MAETVVHVTILEQWKSVLDVWFKQGYDWNGNNEDNQQGRFKNYYYESFRDGCRQLAVSDKKSIYFYGRNGYKGKTIEYSEFMAQQKEDNKMATVYEVSQSVFDELQAVKAHEGTSIIGAIVLNAHLIKSIEVGNKAILRYLADDPAIEFKVKEPLYRLWLIDDAGDKLFFWIDYGRPDWVGAKDEAFTATLDEIKKWQTPAWEIEKVDD